MALSSVGAASRSIRFGRALFETPRVNGWLGGAKLTHLEHVVCQGKWNSGDHPPGKAYEVYYPHGTLHTSLFRLTSDLPIAYVSFSRWDPPETLT